MRWLRLHSQSTQFPAGLAEMNTPAAPTHLGFQLGSRVVFFTVPPSELPYLGPTPRRRQMQTGGINGAATRRAVRRVPGRSCRIHPATVQLARKKRNTQHRWDAGAAGCGYSFTSAAGADSAPINLPVALLRGGFRPTLNTEHCRTCWAHTRDFGVNGGLPRWD